MLTYIEPCAWCSSSISSTYCPSNVDKSIKPCPNLSSSDASTSSISNSDSISINSNSLSYGKKSQTSTYIIRSSFNQQNDYYMTKRIDQLHERMDDIQITSFLKFINYHLSLNKPDENLHINDLIKDLSNGHILIDLIEILSSTKLKREHGHTRFHSLTNIQYVLDYLKLHRQHINISSHDILSGNRKQILALLWIIMKIFDFPNFRFTNKNCFVENTLLGFGQDRSIILKWLNDILNQCLNNQQIYIKDFYLKTWNNGYYLSLILKYLIPLSIKYLTMKCFDYLKELNSSSSSLNKEYFQICLNLSNYCFNTITIIDYKDKSDKCLFRYFTELQQNIFLILKTNHIGKLIQNNPYTKQIVNTIIQTTEHSSHIINDDEQYLVCIKDEKQPTLDQLSRTQTAEKSRLINDEQEKINQWKKKENIQSNSNIINEISKKKQTEEIIDKSEEFNNDHLKSRIDVQQAQSFIESNENLEQIEQQTELIEEPFQSKSSITTIAEVVQPVELNEKTEQSATEEQQQQIISSNEEDTKSEQTIASVKEIEQFTDAIEEQKQILLLNEKIEPLEQTTPTIFDNEPPIDITEAVEHEQMNQHLEKGLEQNAIKVIDNETSIISNEKLEQPTIEVNEIKQFLSQNEKLDQSLIPMKKVEQFIDNKLLETSSNKKTEQTLVEELPQDIIVTEKMTDKKLEKLPVMESQHPIASNGQIDRSINANKKSTVNTKTSIQKNQYPIASNEQRTQSIMIVKEPEQRKVVAERSVPPPPKRCSKYSEILNKQVPKANNESVQITVSVNKQEQSTVSKNKPTSSIIMSNEKSVITTEEIKQVSFTSTAKESEQPQILPEKQDQSIIMIEESSASAISNNEIKTSPSKNKKSRRSNAKKGKAKVISNKTENPLPQQQSVVHIEPIIIQEQLSNNIQLKIENSSTNNEKSPASNSNISRSRKSKKKKTISTTTLIEKPSSSISIPNSTSCHRNLFVIIKDSLYDRKIIAFKCIVILICLCFSIIILVLSHK